MFKVKKRTGIFGIITDVQKPNRTWTRQGGMCNSGMKKTEKNINKQEIKDKKR